MKYLITILIISLGFSLFSQENSWHYKYISTNHNSELYLITDSSLIEFYHDTVKSWEIIINSNGDTVFTNWNNHNLRDTNIVKTEHVINSSNIINKTTYYKNGNYETGASKNYFRWHSRKGIWKIYNKDDALVGYGKYKKFVILKRPIDLIGEGKDIDLKHGKWVYIDSEGDVLRIEKYRKGKLKSTKHK